MEFDVDFLPHIRTFYYFFISLVIKYISDVIFGANFSHLLSTATLIYSFMFLSEFFHNGGNDKELSKY